jgi:hypothetical protein
MISAQALMPQIKPERFVPKGRFGLRFGDVKSDALTDDQKAELGIGKPLVTPPAPEWVTDHEEGYDAFKYQPRIEGVDKAPEWMRQYREGVDKAPEFMKQKPIATYIGPNAKGWNDTDEGKFSRLSDKKERREISDEQAKFTPYDEFVDSLPYQEKLKRLGGSERNKLGDLLKHEELYRQYPEMKDIPVNILSLKDMHGALGSYGDGQISVDADDIRSIYGKDTLLHEGMHHIQEKEGFAGGGSPDEFEKYNKEEMERINKENADRLRYLLREGRASGLSDSEILNSPEGKIIGENLTRLQSEIRFPEKQYRSLAGEVEARDVQARKDMPMSQRLETQPYASQGIPVNKQIVRARPVGASMSVDQKKFDAFVDKALSDNKVQEVMAGGNLTPRQVGDIQKILRIAAEGFFREFRSNDLRHAIQKHGKDKMPITSDDLKGIPSLLNSYDYMKKGTQDALGIPSVKYIKKISNGKTTYVERINPRKKKASNKTMWKEPRGVR